MKPLEPPRCAREGHRWDEKRICIDCGILAEWVASDLLSPAPLTPTQAAVRRQREDNAR